MLYQERLARQNLEALRQNPYPGRLVFVGRPSDCGNCLVQFTAIMGRSANSRNRVYTVGDEGRVFTEAADPTKVEDPHNIIYDAMGERVDSVHGFGVFAASNGHHTKTIVDSHFASGDPFFGFVSAMNQWHHEDDEPNYTPRIAAMVEYTRDGFRTFFGLIRKAELRKWETEKPKPCVRKYFVYDDIPSGFGYYLCTYEIDGDPLPSFRGEPVLIPMCGSPRGVMALLWVHLNADNRIGMAGKLIDPRKIGSKILEPINEYKKVAAV